MHSICGIFQQSLDRFNVVMLNHINVCLPRELTVNVLIDLVHSVSLYVSAYFIDIAFSWFLTYAIMSLEKK